jgi:hypothetical protein
MQSLLAGKQHVDRRMVLPLVIAPRLGEVV